MRICIAETRRSCEVALKLTLLSLVKHCPDLPIELSYPVADADFTHWLEKLPQVRLSTTPLPGAHGWNIKPQALLTLLEQGFDDLVWIDSDIIVTRDFRPLLAELDRRTIAVTEEALFGAHEDPDAMRARGWGFEIGRTLPFTANTGVIRVTSEHVPLLKAWRDLLESEEYRAVQKRSWLERPTHMFSDQDVLTALLASRPFADLPVHYLTRGRDIIQYFGPYGYTLGERLRSLVWGLPPFLHSQVNKPWKTSTRPRKLREYFDWLYLDLSPYTVSSWRYSHSLEADCTWMRPRSFVGGLLRCMGMNHPALVGLPLAMVADAIRWVKRGLKAA
jgi:hypothetical protein